jgi:hypothetical protein
MPPDRRAAPSQLQQLATQTYSADQHHTIHKASCEVMAQGSQGVSCILSSAASLCSQLVLQHRCCVCFPATLLPAQPSITVPVLVLLLLLLQHRCC